MTIPILHVYLDMDGVLVDFVHAALETHRLTWAMRQWPPGLYDMPAAVGIDPVSFWGPIQAQPPEWWAELPATPWADEIARMVERWPITITSLAINPRAQVGKIQWLVSRYGNPPPAYEMLLSEAREPKPDGRKARCFLGNGEPTDDASRACGSGKLLIDDSDAEVDAWRSAGGPAILFPAIWNSAYRWAVDPIRRVGIEIKEFQG